jgi:hypothetical protein
MHLNKMKEFSGRGSGAQFNHIHIPDIALFNLKAEQGPDLMKSIATCRPGIHVQQTEFLIGYNLQNMGVSGDE